MENLPRYVSLGLFLAGLGFLVARVLRELLEPVAWASILAYATWPIYLRLTSLLRGRGGLGALVLVLVLGTAVIVPLVVLSAVLQREIAEFFRTLPEALEGKPVLPPWVFRVPFFGDELQLVLGQFEDLQGMAREYLVPRLAGLSGKVLTVLGGAGFVLANGLFTLFLMFFFYRDGAALVADVRKGLRLGLGPRADDYFATAEITTKAVVYGIVMTALVQAATAGLGYWGVGLPAPVLLTMVTLFAALVPFGTMLVWISAGIWLVAHGEYWPGAAMFLWGALVVSWVDNVVRPLVISRTTQIPFVLVMLGVLGGLAGFGFIGLFLGPVILAVALAVWREWLRSTGTLLP